MIYKCTVCGKEREETVPVLPTVYTVTVRGFGELHLPEDGKYTLRDFEKAGYKILKWLTVDGKEFPTEGTVSANVTVYPVFDVLPTTTVEELEERAAAGAELILIANDITIDRTIYVTGKTVIYSESPVSLIRAADFVGDLFVVGRDAGGNPSIMNGVRAELTLGLSGGDDEQTLLTVDGNRDGVTAEVNGTCFFLLDSGKLTMHGGVKICNNLKVANERLFEIDSFYLGKSTTVGGGAVMISTGSSFYMYGGIIDNNGVNTLGVVNEEDGTTEYVCGYGGAIFNNGTFRMYGGTISNNSANRGGAILNNKVAKIFGGIIENNFAQNKGAAICCTGSDAAELYIGERGAAEDTVTIRNNVAGVQGVAILSYLHSPTVILGGVTFDSNVAQTGHGGVISTQGNIVAYDSKFINNTAYRYGGAIYQIQSSAESLARHVKLTDCLFEGNEAARGGAATFTAIAEKKYSSLVEIRGCTFNSNQANATISEKADAETGEITLSTSHGSGGALYITQDTTVKLTSCEFSKNRAENIGGGAITAAVSSTLSVLDSSFDGNLVEDTFGDERNDQGVGGAIYVYGDSALTVANTAFTNNCTAKNGGAVYLSSGSASLTQTEMRNNSAGLNGGAIAHYSQSVVTIKGIIATGNSATGVGEILYNSLSETVVSSGAGVLNTFGMLGATDEESALLANRASSGGAMCGGNESVFTVSGAAFTNNIAAPVSVEVTDPATGAVSTVTEEGYGGALHVTASSTATINSSTFASNFAKYGGAISLMSSKATLTADTVIFEGNSSTNCGCAIYSHSASATVTNSDFTENFSSRGGALYLSVRSSTTVASSTFTGNSATYGGTVYSSSSTLASFSMSEFTGNGRHSASPAKYGGVFYITKATVNAIKCTFNNNTSLNYGGVAYLAEDGHYSSGLPRSEEGEDPDTADCASTYTNNSALYGGVFYLKEASSVDIEGGTLSDNTAKNGGAIMVNGGSSPCD